MTQQIPKINASPTKEFFVAVLVRDLILEVAIAEFIDNSIEGAKKVNGDEDYSKYHANIKFDKSSFISRYDKVL